MFVAREEDGLPRLSPEEVAEIQKKIFPKEMTERGDLYSRAEGTATIALNLAVNPKGPMGAAKLPLSRLPWAVIAEASIGLGEGGIKYGPHNWRVSKIEEMTYIEAAQRHLMAFTLGQDIDPDSGLHHISKAIASLMVVRDAQINGTSVDNRPPAVRGGAFFEELTGMWAEARLNAEKMRAEMDARGMPAPVSYLDQKEDRS